MTLLNTYQKFYIFCVTALYGWKKKKNGFKFYEEGIFAMNETLRYLLLTHPVLHGTD